MGVLDRGGGEPLLTVESVAKRYAEAWVITEASLKVVVGEAYLILGVNGSGKTTLLRIMAGLTQPSRGRVVISCGRTPSKACVGYVGHTPLLYPEMTVEENLRYYASLYGLHDYNVRDNPAWSTLGLHLVARTRVKHLSFGWRKRADLARALVHAPPLLLLDEPFTGLDEQARQMLSDILVDLRGMGTGIIMASPRWEDVYTALSPRVLSISGGRLAELEGVAKPS